MTVEAAPAPEVSATPGEGTSQLPKRFCDLCYQVGIGKTNVIYTRALGAAHGWLYNEQEFNAIADGGITAVSDWLTVKVFRIPIDCFAWT